MSERARSNLTIAFSIISLVVMIALNAQSPAQVSADCVSDAQCSKIDPGTSKTIDKFSICRVISNASGNPTILVPTNTSAEWTEFLNNAPAGITETACSSCTVGAYCGYISKHTTPYCGGGCSSPLYDVSCTFTAGSCPSTPAYNCEHRHYKTYDSSCNCVFQYYDSKTEYTVSGSCVN